MSQSLCDKQRRLPRNIYGTYKSRHAWWVIRKVDDSRMGSHREDLRRTIDFLDPLLRLPQRSSFVNKLAVIIKFSGEPAWFTHVGSDALSSNHLPDVTRPILLPLASVNQRLPSGPAVIPTGSLLAVGTRNSVMAPVGAVGVTPVGEG
jgi:hypothetical protein